MIWHFFLRNDLAAVNVLAVSRGTVETIVVNTKAGTVEAPRRAKLSARLGGTVKTLTVREGDRVTEGQILLQLENRDYLAQISKARDGLAVAEAELQRANLESAQWKRDLARDRRLEQDGALSTENLERTENRLEIAVATARSLEMRVSEAGKALRVLEEEYDKTILRAPFDGIVAEIKTEVGEYISPSPPGLMIPAVIDLIGSEIPYVSAPMDEIDAGRIGPGMEARVTVDAFPDSAFVGTVVRLAPYVLDAEEQNRTIEVEVALKSDSEARDLIPGTTADVAIILERKPEALRVPSYALLDGGKVFVVSRGIVEERAVSTGLKNWEYTEIVSGLNDGELIVITLDREEVKAGARVTVSTVPIASENRKTNLP